MVKTVRNKLKSQSHERHFTLTVDSFIWNNWKILDIRYKSKEVIFTGVILTGAISDKYPYIEQIKTSERLGSLCMK